MYQHYMQLHPQVRCSQELSIDMKLVLGPACAASRMFTTNCRKQCFSYLQVFGQSLPFLVTRRPLYLQNHAQNAAHLPGIPFLVDHDEKHVYLLCACTVCSVCATQPHLKNQQTARIQVTHAN